MDREPLSQSSSNDIIDEDLVAFLDGELTDSQAKAIQERLANDLALQRKVSELQQSWALLDCLPDNQENFHLAETTIELVALKLQQDRQHSLRAYLKRLIWPLLAGATLVAVLAGVASALLRQRREAQELLQILPLLTRFSDLNLIDSPQWLERLAGIDSLTEAGLPLYEQAEFPKTPRDIDDLDNWVEGLSPVLRLKLYEDYTSFRSLSPVRQKTLREVDALLQREASQDYSQVLKAYSGLISQAISSAEVAQMEANKDFEDRAAKLQHAINRELAIAYANRLSESEKQRIRQWSNRFMEKHLHYFLEMEDPDSQIILLLDLPSTESLVQAEDIQELTECIDQEGQKLLERLEEHQRMKSLRLWAYTASPIHRNRPNYSPEELRRRFQLLPVEQQNRLIYLPGSEVIKQLTDDTINSSD